MSVELALPTEWKKTKIDPAGSFFSTTDFASEGGELAFTGFGRRNDLNGAPRNLSGATARAGRRVRDREASNSGQYGMALRYFLPELNNTELGFFTPITTAGRPLFLATEGDYVSITF
ncbi:MAG: DUF1302 family protein [Sulfuritalea sp.]|nr:DUF1302 family protein [Sulfuritalea sp.]